MALKSLFNPHHDRLPATQGASPFASLQREIDQLFEDFGRGLPSFEAFTGKALSPKMDVSETDGEIEITAELPGLEEKDIDVHFADGILTIKGEKTQEKTEEKKDYHLTERNYGAFSRSMSLPAGTEADKIEASMAKGVLKVRVPKPAARVTQKIDVKPAG
jgi:HSP20 family protein